MFDVTLASGEIVDGRRVVMSETWSVGESRADESTNFSGRGCRLRGPLKAFEEAAPGVLRLTYYEPVSVVAGSPTGLPKEKGGW